LALIKPKNEQGGAESNGLVIARRQRHQEEIRESGLYAVWQQEKPGSGFSHAVAGSKKSPRRTSMPRSFGLASTNGLALEFSGPASRHTLPPPRVGPTHRRAQGGSSLLRSIRPTRATFRSLSQLNGVDGGTAQAGPELPPPPCDRGTG
jgi:hypothetical protein